MCLICVEFDKLTTVELRRNFEEMKASLGDHAAEVEESIDSRELKEIVEAFNEEFDRLWSDLFADYGMVDADALSDGYEDGEDGWDL